MKKRTVLKGIGGAVAFPLIRRLSYGQSGAAFQGNTPRNTQELQDWIAKSEESNAIEPQLPILDAHHHLWGARTDKFYYQLEDLRGDLASGHRIIGTVYCEAYDSGWRTSGEEKFRPVGETEYIADLTERPVKLANGDCQVAAGIVSHADMLLGDNVEDVIREHQKVGQGRLRGIRHRTATAPGLEKMSPGKPNMMGRPEFRRGLKRLAQSGLSFDTYIFHTQIGEVVAIADAFPEMKIVVNHMAVPLGVAEFESRRNEVFLDWKAGIKALAARQNVIMKVGGMGMPFFGFGFEHLERPATAQELVQKWSPLIETVVQEFGTKRCMLESNFPVDKQSTSYLNLWNAFKLATQRWSKSERSDLFFRTACRTYRLREMESLADRMMLSVKT